MTAPSSSSHPLRVTLVITSLSSGGAERVLINLANRWAAQGWSVSLVTYDSADHDFYPAHGEVKRIPLGLAPIRKSINILKVLSDIRARAIELRKALLATDCDVVISFIDVMNVLVLLALFRTKVPVIVSERNDPRFHPIGMFWSSSRRVTYRFASAVVAQTSSVNQWLKKVLPKTTITTIPNPVELRPTDNAETTPKPNSTKPTIVAAGRLAEQKNFQLLLRAFAACSEDHQEWTLTIIGEGEQRSALEQLALELGISKRVALPGRVAEPMQVFKEADLFVLSSNYEGFPNVLLEAMACGLPVISTDCPSGPHDIVRHGVDGILVPTNDCEALTEALRTMMTDPALRTLCASHAPDVLERFSAVEIASQWESVITQVMAESS